MRRLELPQNLDIYSTDLNVTIAKRKTSIVTPMNIIFSQINSVNNQLPELKRLNTLRLFLTRSYRGKCHALGKPVRGQRTWSNAWNSYNYNRTIRSFVGETKKILNKDKKVEKINYKLTQKKYANKTKRKKVTTNKLQIWY